MKLLHPFIIVLLLISIGLVSNTNSYAQNLSDEMLPGVDNSGLMKLDPNFDNVPVNTEAKINKIRKERMLDAEDIIMDSLWNGFSYFSFRQQPFVYDVETGTLVTIKRGALSRDDANAGDNILDNLFIRTSTDWGQTWEDPLLTYNSAQDAPRYMARYPSIYPFMFEDEMTYVYTSPLTDGSGWQGFLNGIYIGVGVNSFSSNASLEVDGNRYGWGTDAKILGGLVEEEPYAIAIGGLLPPDGGGSTAWTDNSNIGYRRTIDFAEWPTVIPEQWASNKFGAVNQDSSRASVIVGLKFASPEDEAAGKMYMGAFGNFVLNPSDTSVVVGFSISNDFGETWSDFETSDPQLVKDYAASKGADPDSTYAPYRSKDFTVLNNGDVSFVIQIHEINANKASVDELHQIVEIYYESGVWGIREISDISPQLWLPYYDEAGTTRSISNNQLDYELQISRTVDGTKLLVKWVDLIGWDVDDQANTFTYQDQDMFMATRVVGSGKWRADNYTDDENIYHRVTWLPDYIPNNMADIPVIEEISIPDPTDDDNMAAVRYLSMFYPQWVVVEFYNAVVGVEESSDVNSDLNIEVYPNPVLNEGRIHLINNSAPADVRVTLNDLTGRELMNVYAGKLHNGLKAIEFSTDKLSSGTYYINMVSGSQAITRMITVIK